MTNKETKLQEIENIFNEKQNANIIPLRKSNQFSLLYRSLGGQLCVRYKNSVEVECVGELSDEQLSHLLEQIMQR